MKRPRLNCKKVNINRGSKKDSQEKHKSSIIKLTLKLSKTVTLTKCFLDWTKMEVGHFQFKKLHQCLKKME